MPIREISRWLAQQTTGRGRFAPLVFQSDEAFQFDWSELSVSVSAQIKLSHSPAFQVRACLWSTHVPLVTFPTEMHCRCLMPIGRLSLCLAALSGRALRGGDGQREVRFI